MGKKKIFTSDAWSDFIAGITALKDKIDGKADEHDHPYLSSNTKYAGASTAGGSATSAVKLDTATAGSATQPVYFTGGKPSACTYSLNKTVPSDAKFTDTTYSAATTSAAGLMSATDKTKSEATNIAYGTCSTAAATAAKVVTISGNTNWKLASGSTITVLFNATNTAENPTLNVNGTGAKNIFYDSTQITTSSLGYAGTANRPMTFMYDGTQYRFIGWGYDSNTTYTNVKLGHGYATCSTAAATTAKVASLSSYTLTTGGIVAVRFTYDVPASATLNINSKGAKNIYYRGAAITAGIIKAGDVATFIYSSQYHLIAIDRWQEDIENSITGLSASGKTITYTKGDGTTGTITTQDTVYTHPTTSGNKHIPSGGSSGQILRWSADGTAVWGADNDTVYTHPTYTARTGKPTANQTPAFGGTATVSQITSDATGHVTAATDRTITIPSTLSNGTGTAGLIKTTSTVTSNSGYTACPVISGVPYYKDTNVAYTHPSYTAQTGVPTANQTPGFGGTFTVNQVNSDATGHVTAVTSRTVTIPSTAASASAAGLVNTGTQTFAGAKTFNAQITASSGIKIGSAILTYDSAEDAVKISFV